MNQREVWPEILNRCSKGDLAIPEDGCCKELSNFAVACPRISVGEGIDTIVHTDRGVGVQAARYERI